LTGSEFSALAADFDAAMVNLNVGAKERADLTQIIAAMRQSIVAK